MTYKLTTQSLLTSLGWVLLFSLCGIMLIFFGDIRFAISVVVIYLVFIIPQLFLVITYNGVTGYKSFQIDYKDQLIIVEFEGEIIEKTFAELRSLQYHKTNVPFVYLSAVLKLCEHFYFYRFEFMDGTIVYLTSLVDPKPKFDPKGAFYTWFIDIERTYATIK